MEKLYAAAAAAAKSLQSCLKDTCKRTLATKMVSGVL